MKIKNVFVSALILGLVAVSCEKDDEVPAIPLGDYENGILISNEGPFNNGTGTVSFISDDFATEESAIFNKVNDDDLGNIVQSIGFEGDEAFIIANVSNKINVVNRYSFEKIATIDEGLNNPRFFVAANGKGYVTNWGDASDETDDFIAIINLETNKVEGTIPVVFGPEKIATNGNTVYVAHKGGFGFNNTISVIATSTNTITTTIEVGDVPDSMQFDPTGNLWVLASGKPSYADTETAGLLSKINITTNTVETNIDFPSSTDHPRFLSIDNNNLFYASGGGVYTMGVAENTLPLEPVLSDASFYTMVVLDGRIFGTDAKDFASKGSLNIYDIANNFSVQTFTVGIIPGGVYLNK